MGWARRDFFKRGAIAGAALSVVATGVGLYSYALEPRLIRLKEYSLKTPKWSSANKSLTVAVAGDLHVGCPSITLDAVDGIVDRLNDMSADIVFLLGDYLIKGVIGGKYTGPDPIGERLSRLKAPPGNY